MLSQPPLWLVIVAFVCAIGPLVFFHELGHYLAARVLGVGAEVFSIGFGTEITGWTDKRGTRWKVGWLPLGGYVRFVGDDERAGQGESGALPENAFAGRPVWQRFLIVLAGPAANFVLAILIFAGFFAAFGMPSTPPLVTGIQPGSAAATAGLRIGDRVQSIDGEATESFEDVRRIVAIRPGADVTIRIERNGQSELVRTRLGSQMEKDSFGQQFQTGLLGVYALGQEMRPVPVLRLIPEATKYTYTLTATTIVGLKQMIGGERSFDDAGGPVKIAQIAGQQALLGPLHFVQLLALLSINLGFINLLPVPVLDGGHLLFYTVEAVRRRPMSIQAQEWAFRGGLALLLALLLFTTVNDLGSFGVWERLGRLIG